MIHSRPFTSLLLFLASAQAYHLPYVATRRSALQMKRGRGSLGREVGGGMGSSSKSSSASLGSNLNWCPIPATSKDLPKQSGKVVLLDTDLPTLKNSATNPTGAVSAVEHGGQTYCFPSSCPSCQIPLTKAKIYAGIDDSKGAPRLCCDFCKSTYSLKDGAKLAAAESGGLLSGVVKSLLSAKDSGPLKMYKLAEKNGKLLIALD